MLFKNVALCGSVFALSIAILTIPPAGAQQIANNVPDGTRQASDLGRVASAQEITITVQLQLQDKAAFDKAVDALYDPESPTFHKWLTEEDLKKYAPARSNPPLCEKSWRVTGLKFCRRMKMASRYAPAYRSKRRERVQHRDSRVSA